LETVGLFLFADTVLVGKLRLVVEVIGRFFAILAAQAFNFSVIVAYAQIAAAVAGDDTHATACVFEWCVVRIADAAPAWRHIIGLVSKVALPAFGFVSNAHQWKMIV
jgi:hypothetical protein